MSVTAFEPLDPADEPAGFIALEDYDVTMTLHKADEVTRRRRGLEVESLMLAQHFARLHADDPAETEPGPRPPGATRLVRLGGEGTPMVQDLPICELAIALRCSDVSARKQVADGLDLEFRLPKFWLAVREGESEVWVARRVAGMTRHLSPEAVASVDEAVADVAGTLSPGRLLSLLESEIVKADTEAARAEREAERRRRFVKLGRTDEFGLRMLFTRVDAGDAVWIDAITDRIADILADRPDLVPDLPVVDDNRVGASRDELRAIALGWLAHPQDALALLQGTFDPETATGSGEAVLYVHLDQPTPDTATGDLVADVEQVGAMLIEQMPGLLGHARIIVKPVIDLNLARAVDGYRHPADVAERTFLRTGGDVFPHAAGRSRRVDDDHPTPYDEHGPPGQTGDHNDAPLGRRSHRAKTHLGYRCTQVGLGEYVWSTPHGLHRLVDPSGTHEIDELTAWVLRTGRGP